jgi:hypothetical protein
VAKTPFETYQNCSAAFHLLIPSFLGVKVNNCALSINISSAERYVRTLHNFINPSACGSKSGETIQHLFALEGRTHQYVLVTDVQIIPALAVAFQLLRFCYYN